MVSVNEPYSWSHTDEITRAVGGALMQFCDPMSNALIPTA